MRLRDMSWMQVEQYLASGQDTIMLITGATEQHAYLSLLTDILIPEKLADAVLEQESVLVAPALNFGYAPLSVDFAGTISISRTTFDLVLYEIVQGLMTQGFRRFFILNGHGGNKFPQELADMDLGGEIAFKWYDWWHSDAVKAFERDYHLQLDHANWGENFPFNRVGLTMPQTEKPPVNLAYLEEGMTARDLLGDGSFGGRYQVDDALMLELFDRVVVEIVKLLRQLKQR